jgi:hypothetical protein
MTIQTMRFRADKLLGYVTKGNKVRFIDGMREYERVLWHDEADGNDYVILNGEAEIFTPYSDRCQVHEFVIGWI